MILFSNYEPPSKAPWKGRHDPYAKYIHEIIECVNVQEQPFEHPKESTCFGIVGFASDEGILRNQGHLGASAGPTAFREALAPLPHPNIKIYDLGNIVCDNGDLEEAQRSLAILIEFLHQKHIFPLVLGGGHEVAWGHFQGLMKAYPEQKISIINFDAHFDMRPLLGGEGSSGTSFLQIAQNYPDFNCTYFGIQKTGNTQALFNAAHDLKAKYLLADEFHLGGIGSAMELLEETLQHSEMIYVSLCLDVFASAFAPGVSSPQPLGLFPWHVIPLLHRLADSGKVVSLDIAELCPSRDQQGLTAKLGASLLHHFIRLLA